jgi:hypothetical protein
MPDSKFKVEYRIENFIYLHDALQLPQEIRTANRLCFDTRDALMTFLRQLGESSRKSTVGDLTSRDRSAVSRIVKLVASMIAAKWWAGLLLDPHRLIRASLGQYERVIETDGCPYEKLVGFIDGSRCSISRHGDAAIQTACYSAKYKKS